MPTVHGLKWTSLNVFWGGWGQGPAQCSPDWTSLNSLGPCAEGIGAMDGTAWRESPPPLRTKWWTDTTETIPSCNYTIRCEVKFHDLSPSLQQVARLDIRHFITLNISPEIMSESCEIANGKQAEANATEFFDCSYDKIAFCKKAFSTLWFLLFYMLKVCI